MAEKKVSAGLKTALEMGPILLFFVAYIYLKDREFVFGGETYGGFIVVTALFIPLLLASTFVLWRLTGELSRMQVLTAVLVVVFGGLGIWFNDEKFFKIKPTIIYLIFGGILGFGLMRGQSYLRLVMNEAIPLTNEGWMILTKRFAGFFVFLAAANEVVWRTQSTETWVTFKTFVLTAALFVFVMTQAKLFSEYSSEKD